MTLPDRRFKVAEAKDKTAAGNRDDLLGAVYEAQQPKQVAELYDKWAATYDVDMASVGYRHPSICLALLARYLPRDAAPLLDAGAGTGLAGEWLGIIGYDHVEALDISPGMLEVARSKKVYKRLHVAALGGELPFADGTFAGIVSSGVFTTGHVGPDGLDDLVRICRPGGVIVLTVKLPLWTGGFADHVNALAARGLLTLIEQTPPYASMPDGDSSVPSLAIVLKMCG